MRTTWAVRIAAPLAAAALIVGCSRGDHSSAASRDRLGGLRYEMISLKGCVEVAPGSKAYVLRQIHIDPVATQKTDTPTSHGLSVTEGSWVRLRDDSDQLKPHVGQQVAVSGTILDDGRNTIGTSGKASEPEAGTMGHASQSNGNAPEMAVEHVRPTGQPCAGVTPEDAGR